MDAKKKLLRIVEGAQGDDLERVRLAFRGVNLDSQWGLSGKTCRQILAEYEQERADWQKAYDLAKSLDQ